MFLGSYEHTIDAKGRLFLPVKFREGKNAEGKFIVTQGLENCLYLFTPQGFHENLAAKLSHLPVKNQQDARAFRRMLLAGATEVILDDLGRILIPKAMLAYAGMKKEISVLGVGERVELWSTPVWKKYNKKASQTFERLGRQLDI
jgi:MraZ protein